MFAKQGNNKDFVWIEIPVATDNRRNDYIPRKHYATSRPTSWILQEMDGRNLTNNIAVISKHYRWGSGTCPLMAGKISRGASIDLGNAVKRETL